MSSGHRAISVVNGPGFAVPTAAIARPSSMPVRITPVGNVIPSDNKRDVADVPDAILTATQWQFYDTPTKAAIMAMGMV